jgi:hypothetical protein
VYRRRQLAADCAGLTTQLVQRLTDAALPATLEALAAAGATAAHDPALGPRLLGWLGGVAGPAAVRFECPANVIWPDLRWREAVFERPSVLVVDGDVNDATPYVRLPRDRKWLVAVGKVAMSVRRTLQSNVRGNWLAVAQIAPGESRPQVLGHLSRLAAAAGTDVNQAGEEPTAIGSVVLARLTSASLVVEAGSAASGDPMRADRRSDETVEAYVARSARLSRVERVIEVARQTGVLPGGGAALRWHGADIARGVSDPVLANVFRAVTSAPLLALLPAAEDVASRVAAVDQSSHGYDPVRGDVVDLASNGVLDPCGVVVAALRATIDAGSRYAEI